MKAINKLSGVATKASGIVKGKLKDKFQKPSVDENEVVDHLEEEKKLREELLARTEKEAVEALVNKIIPSGYEFFKGHDRLIDMLVSRGHMQFQKLTNYARFENGKQPARIMAAALLVAAGLPALYFASPVISSAALSFPRAVFTAPASLVSSFVGSDDEAGDVEDENFFEDEAITGTDSASGQKPFDLQAWVISHIVDYDTGAALPDGQVGHIRWKFAQDTPLKSGFAANAEDFDTFAEKALSLQEIVAENNGKVAELNGRLSKIQSAESNGRQNSTEVWNAWLDAKSLTLDLEDVGLPIVSVADFWKSDGNLEAMAKTGVVAKSNSDGNIIAATYVDGTPSINIIGSDGCQNVFGRALSEDCKTIKKDASEPPVILQQMYGVADAGGAQENNSVAQMTVPDRWYLNLPKFDPSKATLTPKEFNTMTKFVARNVSASTGYWEKYQGALDTVTWTLASQLQALPVFAPLKGLWNSPEVIDAMSKTGVVAKLSDKRFLIAASVDGKPAARVLNASDNSCVTVFGETYEGCAYGNVTPVVAGLKQTFATTDEKPVFSDLTFYSKVPFHGPSAFKNANEYVNFFNTVLSDFQRYGGQTRDEVSKWKNGAFVTRPDTFLNNLKAIEALSQKGVYIAPEYSKNQFLLAAYVDGKLQLDVVSLENRLSCQTIVGQQYVSECRQGDFDAQSELIKSLF
ncbi:hypothetical protein [Brucella tritici]|uniref:Uncharacterized protein n=1 Tax=Brucella tritici TaxID=94626 RepID=A0A6L3YDI7_9HYPH|nr:hypothetical protein [Brucella tritici]KAB2678064.1 hypothetical protein F9L08_24390 [Brucella tritici]